MHDISYYSFDTKVSKKEIENQMNEICRRNSDYKGGLYSKIEWYDGHVYDSFESARDYINEHYCGDYQQVAFKYYDYNNIKKTKRQESLEKKLAIEYQKLMDLEDFHFKGIKQKFISCKRCGSSISVEYLRGNYCPVCRKDLRPPTKLKSIETKKTKIAEIEKQISIEERKKKKQAEIKWNVKIEFHS